MIERNIGITYTMFPDTRIPMVIRGVKKPSEEHFHIASNNDGFFKYKYTIKESGFEVREAAIIVINPELNTAFFTGFSINSRLDTQTVYGDVKTEQPFFGYDPSARAIIFPNGNFIRVSGTIVGGVGGKFWQMREPNQWQLFGGLVIKIDRYEDGTHPNFSLIIGETLDTNKLVIATVRLPKKEDVEGILYGENLLGARTSSLGFAIRVRFSTPKEEMIINNLFSRRASFDE